MDKKELITVLLWIWIVVVIAVYIYQFKGLMHPILNLWGLS